jgi:3-keto-disaccharide hydrolase/GMC oxidoreductase
MSLRTENTTFTRDVLGRYLLNTFDEARSTDFRRFDIVIVGGGSFGAAMAEQLFQLGKRNGHRILVLEGGPFVLPEHVQNLPPLHARIASPGATTLDDLRNRWRLKFGQEPPALLDRNQVEEGVEVWGLPWHSREGVNAQPGRDKRFPGLAYCVGGRSLFWGGWSPELIDSELASWPAEVVSDLQGGLFAEAARQLGSDVKNDFISGALHSVLLDRLVTGIGGVTDALAPASKEGFEAPLAVQSSQLRSGSFPVNKFSAVPLLAQAARSAETESPGNDFGKRLMIVPDCHVASLHVGPNRSVDRIETNFGPVDVRPNAIVIVALGTLESTRLALLSFPNANGLIGRNLMAHLRSNTTIRIPRSAFPALPDELQASALFVKGRSNGRHFHIQITGCGVSGDVRDSEIELNKKIPDIDGIDAFTHVTDEHVVVTLRGIGEMESNRTPTSPSWIELDPECDEHGVRRAIVTLGLTAADQALWDAMDAAVLQTAQVLAGGGALEYLNEGAQPATWQASPWTRRDGLGTTHHEAGTLWMGSDPASSVTDPIGRFHEIDNAYAVGPALFPAMGSPNPMLAGIALVRRTARALVPEDTAPSEEAGFTSLFDGSSVGGWQMVGSGGFLRETETADDGTAYGVLRSQGGPGVFWYTAERFRDFVLRLDWKTTRPDDNSGVFVRFPAPGGDPGVPVDQGYEVQIDDLGRDAQGRPGNPLFTTGAVYGFAPPRRLASRLVGEWNRFEIRVEGQRYRVALNGETVSELAGTRSLEGHVGLQCHGPGSRVLFRNVRIRAIP